MAILSGSQAAEDGEGSRLEDLRHLSPTDKERWNTIHVEPVHHVRTYHSSIFRNFWVLWVCVEESIQCRAYCENRMGRQVTAVCISLRSYLYLSLMEIKSWRLFIHTCLFRRQTVNFWDHNLATLLELKLVNVHLFCLLVFSCITDTREWRYFKQLYQIHSQTEEGLFNRESKSHFPEVFLRPKETVNIPFKYLMFKADHSVKPQVIFKRQTTLTKWYAYTLSLSSMLHTIYSIQIYITTSDTSSL